MTALKEIVKDYKDRIVTPVYVGIRAGFLKNEEEVKRELTVDKGFVLTTAIDAARQLTESLPGVSPQSVSPAAGAT